MVFDRLPSVRQMESMTAIFVISTNVGEKMRLRYMTWLQGGELPKGSCWRSNPAWRPRTISALLYSDEIDVGISGRAIRRLLKNGSYF